MTQEDFTGGLSYLNELSLGDYHQSLQEVYNQNNDRESVDRIGRLIGVALKHPFADGEELPFPSSYSRSYRRWELKQSLDDILNDPSVKNTWQYQTLKKISEEYNLPVDYIIGDAKSEKGFWGYLGKSATNYICGNQELRDKIKESVDIADKRGIKAEILNPENLITMGGASLGAYLVQTYPAFGLLGAPAIAGIVIVLYRIGLEAFCEYMDDYFSGADKEK